MSDTGPTNPDNLQALLQGVRCLVLDVDGVLTDGHLIYSDSGVESKAFHVQDGAAIKMLQACGIVVAILSGRRSKAVTQRAEDLGMQHVILGSKDKAADLLALAERIGVEPSAMAHMGDDIPDLAAFSLVGFRISVANAHPEVASRADYVTATPGGSGAVREIAHALLTAQGLWDQAVASAQ